MKIKAGKSYRTRSGEIVHSLWGDADGYYLCNQVVGGYLPVWNHMGEACFFGDTPDSPEHDLVEEVE